MKILFACDECGEDHIIDSRTKEVVFFDKTVYDYCSFQAVSYEEDTIDEENAKALDGLKWKCTKCGTEMKEEYYTKTTYHI